MRLPWMYRMMVYRDPAVRECHFTYTLKGPVPKRDCQTPVQVHYFIRMDASTTSTTVLAVLSLTSDIGSLIQDYGDDKACRLLQRDLVTEKKEINAWANSMRFQCRYNTSVPGTRLSDGDMDSALNAMDRLQKSFELSRTELSFDKSTPRHYSKSALERVRDILYWTRELNRFLIHSKRPLPTYPALDLHPSTITRLFSECRYGLEDLKYSTRLYFEDLDKARVRLHIWGFGVFEENTSLDLILELQQRCSNSIRDLVVKSLVCIAVTQGKQSLL